jgi:hypothetical protein
LDRRLGGPQSRSGHGGEEKNFHPLPGLEPPIIQPAAQRYTTEISRFLLLAGMRIFSVYYVVPLSLGTDLCDMNQILMSNFRKT